MKCIFYLIIFICSYWSILADKPCAVKRIPGQSVVCVCNASYCDDVIRETPKKNSYIAYTSSQAGLRLKKSRGIFTTVNNRNIADRSITLELNPSVTYQSIEGFGGAVTDAAGLTWLTLPPKAQDNLINSYFSKNGIEYNMVRVPIGGSDFSTYPYAYNELPVNDTKLTNYTLTEEDFNYKIPMIKSIMKAATTDVHVVATTWSPPLWMKIPPKWGGYNRLRPKYFQTYADYHLKFIQKYNETGIPIWGITTTNEPMNGEIGLIPFNSLGWEVNDMGNWIINNLAPTIRNSDFKYTKIIMGDDQRLFYPYWYNLMSQIHPNVFKYIDGFGVHWYTDTYVPPLVFEPITKNNPDKFILATEACQGGFDWQKEKVLLGSWSRAKSYITNILQDLNYNLVGWIDWNLCLDSQGGPNWVQNFVDSPIIIDKEKQEFYKQPMFYSMAHVAKFLPRGSIRIKAVKRNDVSSVLDYVAFITIRNSIVVVIYNDGDEVKIKLRKGNKQTTVLLAAHSIVTVELSNA